LPAPPPHALTLTDAAAVVLSADRLATRASAVRRTNAWARYVRAMDPGDLVLAEQATYDPTQPALAVPR
jgi:hypothetical protein